MSVAFSVGPAVLIGVMRILKGWPIHYLTQLLVLRQKIPHLRRPVLGGLENALFPLGKIMATQLSDPESFLYS